MKVHLLRSFKMFLLVLVVFLASCKKDQDHIKPTLPTLKSGSLVGSIKLLNRQETENLNFSDFKIHLTDSLNTNRLVKIDTDGKFRIDNIPYGKVLLEIDKPGYGSIKTLGFRVGKIVDTLTRITLAEELPFSFNSFSISIKDKRLDYSRKTTYQTNDSYMVGEFVCFSTDPNVSLDNCMYVLNSGGAFAAFFINNVLGSASSFSVQDFTKKGFKVGDKIYAVLYPVIRPRVIKTEDFIQNFDIISFKKPENPSNVSSFTLHE